MIDSNPKVDTSKTIPYRQDGSEKSITNELLSIILSVLLSMITWITLPVMGGFYGGISGYILGICYGDVIKKVLLVFIVKQIEPWEIGIVLGILTSFLKISFTVRKED